MARGRNKFDPRVLIALITGPDDDDLTLALRLDCDRQQIFRWRNGLVRFDAWSADKWAIRAGYHPSLVWGQQWWDESAKAAQTRRGRTCR